VPEASGFFCLLTARHQGIRELVAVDVAVTRRRLATPPVATGRLCARSGTRVRPRSVGLHSTARAALNVASQVVERCTPRSRIALVGVTAGEVPPV